MGKANSISRFSVRLLLCSLAEQISLGTCTAVLASGRSVSDDSGMMSLAGELNVPGALATLFSGSIHLADARAWWRERPLSGLQAATGLTIGSSGHLPLRETTAVGTGEQANGTGVRSHLVPQAAW